MFSLHNWQLKLISLTAAILLWLFIDHSIIEVKTIPNVPIRIVNLPVNKTIAGLMPNGIYKKRIALTLVGSRDVVHELEPGDIEVIVDASMIDRDDWILRIGKKNLISLNPSIDVANSIKNVTHNEFVIKMAKVITAEVPLKISSPIGELPDGYELLNIWPLELKHNLTGPRDDILSLKEKGLKVTFNLSDLSKEELDKAYKEAQEDGMDEFSVKIPTKWKFVHVGFRNNAMEEFNDPDAEYLQLDILKRDLVLVGQELPIQLFYPIKTSSALNPLTTQLVIGGKVEEKNGIPLLIAQTFMKGVSKTFVEVIKGNVELEVLVTEPSLASSLMYSVNIVSSQYLESIYVSVMSERLSKDGEGEIRQFNRQREKILRERFRKYLKRTQLWSSSSQLFVLDPVLRNSEVIIQ